KNFAVTRLKCAKIQAESFRKIEISIIFMSFQELFCPGRPVLYFSTFPAFPATPEFFLQTPQNTKHLPARQTFTRLTPEARTPNNDWPNRLNRRVAAPSSNLLLPEAFVCKDVFER